MEKHQEEISQPISELEKEIEQYGWAVLWCNPEINRHFIKSVLYSKLIVGFHFEVITLFNN